MNDRDLVERDAETVRDNLSERRFVALAMAVRTSEDFDGTDRIDANLSGFPKAYTRAETADGFRRSDAAGFDVTGQANAAQLAFFLRLFLPRGETSIVDGLQCRVERGIKVTGVIG